MIIKKQITQKLKELIEEFRFKYSYYKSLSEADVETKLIEALFIDILGWNKNDFFKQQQAKREGKQGRVDYAFKIGDRTVFYLEVKKVGISLDKEADKQVISYALSRRVPFAISTNFGEMKIFCVEEGDEEKRVFRVFSKPEEYLEKLQDLLLLTKDSFKQDLLLKEAIKEERLKKRISIDKPLLEDLMYIRKLISDDLEKKYSGKYNINEKDEIIQRIIDRLIFIRRCEDIGINPNDIKLEELRHLPQNKTYSRLKEIFKVYNDVYNSGLFVVAKDNDCDDIDLNGKIIQDLAYLLYESKDKKYIYNFDWIDADVLGQVYEQYLGKILQQTKSGRAKLKDSQAHRKEQGIYYTPTYIVDYIVKNTIGELLKDKKVKTKDIKILDPACGSGSFLIKAFDYLNGNLSKTDEAKQHKIDNQGPYSIKTEILKNNIFGVDLDNKAVEITKLNLLLKAAEKNRKLPEEVDMHIKHGNSLINDESVAGLDAFKWIGDFQEGSFDVVIGNPPYIRIQNMDGASVEFFNNNFKSATKNYDIYSLFVEKGFSLLKENGLLGFILPSKFFNADYGEGLRKIISEKKCLYKIVDFKDFQVFDAATTYTCLLFLKKSSNKDFEYCELLDKDQLAKTKKFTSDILNKTKQKQPEIGSNWNFVSSENMPLMEKISKIKLILGDISKNIFQGLITGSDKIYFVYLLKDEGKYAKVKNKLDGKEFILEKEILKKLLKGKEIRRWEINWQNIYIVYPYEVKNDNARLIPIEEIKSKYPKTYNYFLNYEKELKARENNHFKNEKNWHQFGRLQNIEKFEQTKIATQVLASKNSFTLDATDNYYFVGGGNAGGYGITLKQEYSNGYYWILSLLNSRLLEFYLKKISTHFRGGFYSYGKRFIEKLPIIIPNNDTKKKLSDLSKKQLELNKQLIVLGDKNTAETKDLKDKISNTDKEIDQEVYKIYGITKEEQRIIEESLK